MPVIRQNGLPIERIVRSYGCNQQHFLLNRDGTEYHALFNDPPSDENIDPLSGTPRPDPDPAVRTKTYALPVGPITTEPERKTPSKFSGLMRQAVGCYYATGREAPFTFGWYKTHGIVKIGSTYWVVEISPAGVFAVVVTVGSECCGSYDVTRFMTPPSTDLALHSRWQNFDQVNVQRVLRGEQVVGVYSVGSPWWLDHGWAFSQSGVECQNVVYNVGSDPCSHYIGARVKITFSKSGPNTLVATPTIVEQGKKFTLLKARKVWTPTGIAGQWSGNDGPSGNEVPNPLALIPAQNAPIHVFYAGEVEQVTRWTLSYSDQPATSIGPPLIALIQPQATAVVETCYVGSDLEYTPGWNFFSLSQTSAHKLTNAGYTGPGFGYVGESYLRSYFESHQATGGTRTITQTNPNFFTLKPDCYYYFEGHLITQCTCVFTVTSTFMEIGQEITNGTQSKTVASCIVLLMEEREGILAIGQTSSNDYGNSAGGFDHLLPAGVSVTGTHSTDPEDEDSLCPCPEYDISGGFPGSGPPIELTGAYDNNFNTVSSTASATLALNAFGVAIGLTTSAFDGAISDGNFLTFMLTDAEHTIAESAVFAMHGNLGDAINRIYFLQTPMTVGGGFPYVSGEAMAFIGKV